MRTQIIAERQGPTLLRAARLNDMDVVSVGPYGRPMEEGAEGIVWMRHVDVTELCETVCVFLDGLKATNRDLDVDDGLRGEPAN
jgi:hypothetical protein